MKALAGCTALFLLACGPSLAPEPVMTPQQRLQEQERLAYEAEQRRKDSGERGVWEEEEENTGFDEEGAKQELQRATLGAQTCGELTLSPVPQSNVKIEVTWSRDGYVRKVDVMPPFKDHDIEPCLVSAYKAVIVQPFSETDYQMSWEFELNSK